MVAGGGNAVEFESQKIVFIELLQVRSNFLLIYTEVRKKGPFNDF